MTQKFRLDNKISVVTGGSRGIGLGIAKALAQALYHGSSTNLHL